MADTSTQTALQKAAETVNAAEVDALQKVLDATVAYDAALKSMLDNFGLPATFPSNARRIAGEMRSNIGYRFQTELPNLIAQINGQTATPAP